ncbi:MAG: OsmC family protein [Flavobacteriales bacterium]|jgi:putative redox protein|nr:OsmC family protein [Flavobacteriales bacterium]
MDYHVKYLGNLRNESTHLRSGNSIITDAPVDNHGKGEAFSPTDLASVSLANCMMTIVAIAADTRNLVIESMEAEVKKEMASNPRRISAIHVRLRITGQFTDKEKTILHHAALTCPVALSLHPDVNQNIEVAFAE